MKGANRHKRRGDTAAALHSRQRINMRAFAIAALLGCTAVTPSTAFTGRVGFARTAGSGMQSARSRRAATTTSGVRMMAIDPVAVHSVGDYVNAVGTSGLDHTWLSHVMHGERVGTLLAT